MALQTFVAQHRFLTTWLKTKTLTNVCKIRGADLFDLVEAGVQVGRLFRQGGNRGHVRTDLLAVH